MEVIDMGYVYFIQPENDSTAPVKIGYSINPVFRLASLQCGSPYKLGLLSVIRGGRALERKLHVRFESNRSHGEWFYSSDELIMIIKSGLPASELTPIKMLADLDHGEPEEGS